VAYGVRFTEPSLSKPRRVQRKHSMGYAWNGAHQGVEAHHGVLRQVTHHQHCPLVAHPVDDLCQGTSRWG
jgi:hypothetical protein